MLYLVATKETQGRRKNDFSWADEGEPVHFAFECDRDKNNIDGGCGCRRAMSGLNTHKATTTFKVADIDTDVVALLKKHFTEGWRFSEEEATKMAEQEAAELRRNAEFFGEGTILEKRGNRIKERLPEKATATA